MGRQLQLPAEAEPRRFLFIVHPLTTWHRGLLAIRWARWWGLGDHVGPLCRVRLGQRVEGVVFSIGLTPHEMLQDQQRALQAMVQAVSLAGPVDAVGLGSLCAAVAGRGTALQGEVSVPVTTGGAATAWALVANTLAHHQRGPVAVIGAKGAVGGAVVKMLKTHGLTVRADAKRVPEGVVGLASAEEAVQGCSVVVGAATTGPTVDASALEPGTVVVDVAIPGSLRGHRRDIKLVAGEALALPHDWKKGFWGTLFHTFAGYGQRQVFACLIEPLVLAMAGGDESLALGRRVDPGQAHTVGEMALGLGFVPMEQLMHGGGLLVDGGDSAHGTTVG